MRVRERLIWLAVAVCTLLALPAAADAAKAGFEVKPKQVTLLLDLDSSNGSSVTVQTRGDMVFLRVDKGGATAIYRTEGTVSLRRIEADFGSFGRISAQFSGRTRVGDLSQRCRGRNPIVATGSYRGSFQFRGEDGYVEVATDRAEGVGLQAFRRICRKRANGNQGGPTSNASARLAQPELSAVLLSARSKSDEREINFAEIGVESIDSRGKSGLEPIGLVVASIKERHEDVAIKRIAFDFEGGPFIVSPPDVRPVSITVAPPRPYTGTAAFLQEPGSPSSWSGDLAVSLPGAPATPLTGPDFRATFCRILHLDDAELDKCSAEIEGASASAQLSGSQSQAFGDTRLSWLR